MAEIQKILEQFGLDPTRLDAIPFGSGLIHTTYVIKVADEPRYIFQQVNHRVFKKPEDIAYNVRVISNYLRQTNPGYLFTTPVHDKKGNDFVMEDGNYYRLFEFVNQTHTIDVCTEPHQAWEAARQFGKFTSVLKDFRTDMLRYTIPGFHDLSFRYQQFEDALIHGDARRIKETALTRQRLLDHKSIVERYKQYKNSSSFKQRVTHHDTKISNVLFDDMENGVCVIDLDTVMPGLFISDVGDMIRTYVSPANEEENELGKVVIRKDFLDAIISGYSEDMYDLLTEEERGAFIYAGDFMIYMQALRFYTDHLNQDKYYGAAYEGHNHMRALNQLKLLDELIILN